MLTERELDEMLAEVEEQREVLAAKMRRVEEAVAIARRMQEARANLASADWFEDSDTIQPRDWLTLSARPEEIRRAYQKYGARFEVDREGGAHAAPGAEP